MKRLLIVFGVLDILSLVRTFFIKISHAGIWTEMQIHVLDFLKYSLYVSFAFSAFFLIRQNKIGIWLSYGQFLPRVFFMAYSFGFVLWITDHFGLGNFDQAILFGLLLLDIIRIVLTIRIHRKYYRNVSVLI